MICLCLIIKIGVFFGAILGAIKLYMKLTSAWCRSQTCLVGKTAIVTGANTGIGYETALDFAKRGARVILACRNQSKGDEAVAKIIKKTHNQNVVLKLVDMASFKSVREFARDINATEERLDILVNNAGLVGVPAEKTEDGQLVVIQVNYLSSFLLTNLLGNLLKKTGSSRIVNVSSIGGKYAELDIENLNHNPGPKMLYFRTKLCNILFTKELANRLSYTSVTTYSLHPGVVNTDIFRHLPSYFKVVFDNLIKHLFKTSEEGAQTTIYTSVAQGIEKYNGEHFHDCHKVKTYKTASNPEDPKKLWDKTVELIKMSSDEQQI